MKKRKLLLTAALLFATTACNQPSTSQSESEPLPNSDSSTTEVVESTTTEISTPSFDTSKYQQAKFLDVEELYLHVNETYELSKMAMPLTDLDSLTYVSSISENVSVDENGRLVGLTHGSDSKVSGTIYVHTDSKLQEIKVHIVDKEEYGSYFTSVDLGRLYNKNVMFFGDSITHNWAKNPWGRLPETDEEWAHSNSVTSLGYPTHYIPLLEKQCKFASVVNAAWSGGTMAYRPSGRPIYKSFPYCVDEHEENIKKTDYIFVLYGTNDADEQVPIGSLTDTLVTDGKTNGTFVGSMRYGIETIRKFNPDAQIIFMNILYRSRVVIGENQVTDYNEAIANTCLSYACRMIDTYSMYDASTAAENLNSDGLHLSDKGYANLVDYLLNNGKKED